MKCRIAILDSGIDRGCLISNPNIICDGKVDDDNGHGTMCYSVIKMLAPEAEFYIGKILNGELRTSTEQLIQKLAELLKKNVDVIHLSLSTNNEELKTALEEICCSLYNSGKIIVAAHDNNKNLESYPCDFRTVIGVDGGIFESNTEFLYDANRKVQAIANKVPILVKGRKEEYHFFGGTSKAAACMSGIIAAHWDVLHNDDYQVVLSNLTKTLPKKKSTYLDTNVAKYVENEIMPYILSDFNETNIRENLKKFERKYQCVISYEELSLLDFQNSKKLSEKLSGFIRR